MPPKTIPFCPGGNECSKAVKQEGKLFVALCPELDIASQGATVEEAITNLEAAVELFLECAESAEIEARLHR